MRPQASILLLVVSLGAAACGRLGFEAHELGGDGGPPDARDGDGSTDLPDGGPGPGGCIGTLIVTTSSDEADAGESPEPPHLGAGLSLREAIAIANDRDGLDCITFSGPASILLGSELPALEDPSGTAIDGDGVVSIVSGGAVPTGLRLVSEGNQIYDLELADILVCIQVNGAGNVLRGLHLHDCATTGIVIAAAAQGSKLGPCLMHDIAGTAVQALGTSGLEVVSCTITKNGGSGIDATAGGADLLVENSILSDNRDYGVALDPDAPASLDYDDLFGNRLQDCLNCTPGPSSIAMDPLFVDDVGDDYNLMAGSPAIDAGRINGLDVNGAIAGDYNGGAPDMGGLESP